jgi:hypothetical protein
MGLQLIDVTLIHLPLAVILNRDRGTQKTFLRHSKDAAPEITQNKGGSFLLTRRRNPRDVKHWDFILGSPYSRRSSIY